MRYVIVGVVVLAGIAGVAAQRRLRKPCRVRLESNGAVAESTYQADKAVFDELEVPGDGLGSSYNAQSCREWP